MFRLFGTISLSQHIGERDYQEDRLGVFVLPKQRGHVLAVFDGHGGDEVSQQSVAHLEALVQKYQPTDPEKTIRGWVRSLDHKTKTHTAGSTVSLAIIDEVSKKVTTAVLGDSPIVILDRQGQLHTSEEHNVRSNDEELEAVLARGGVYEDGYVSTDDDEAHGLQLSRALGNEPLRDILDQKPAVSTFSLGQRSFVLLTSDGFFEEVEAVSRSEQEASVISLLQGPTTAAQLLTERARWGLSDNTSLVFWQAQSWWQARGSRLRRYLDKARKILHNAGTK